MKKIDIFKLLGIDFLLAILTIFIKDYFKIETSNSYEEDFREHKLLAFVIIGFIIPIIEEFLFRYHLVRTKYTYITLVLSSILFFVFFQKTYYIVVFFIILNCVSFYFYFSKESRKLPIWLVVVYSVCFSLLHLNNYDVSILQKYTWYFVLLFCHYLISSFFISYIRLKEPKFIYVIIYHIFYNCLGFIFYEIYK